MFQGEEYDESRPFQYFNDHISPLIADGPRKGRRREFSELSDVTPEQIPDAQDRVTFGRSRRDPSNVNPEHVRYYKGLIALRRKRHAEQARGSEEEDRRLLRFRRGEGELIADFRGPEQDGVPPRRGVVWR